jgi:hypothetical protein
MRDAINNNPIAQMAVVGVLLVVTAFLLMSGPLKKEETPAPEAGTPETGSALPSTGVAPPAPGATAAPTGAVGTAPPVVPGPPLPEEIAAARADGKVLALLVVRAGGHDDRLLRGAVAKLRGVPGLALFTTRAEGIARYARITQGAQIDRVPALVVVRPPETAGAATAEVRYGFRDAQSVVQAVRDALYQGPTVGYSPE